MGDAKVKLKDGDIGGLRLLAEVEQPFLHLVAAEVCRDRVLAFDQG